MKKTLYSLTLDDDIVREVDALAHSLGTNRSNLINQILAEHVNCITPERRINDLLSAIERMVRPSRELVPHFAPNAFCMSLKSSLEYKYRPTIKYEVELYRDADKAIGELSVIFRTQSEALLGAMADFFRLWKRIEDLHLGSYAGVKNEFTLYPGKFLRSISQPDKKCDCEELAGSITEYIKFFDKTMKAYLAGRLSAGEVEAEYYTHMITAAIHF